jgi:acetylornithine deacetylase/succinyl-diaminopimelate desuccinylase-like protein
MTVTPDLSIRLRGAISRQRLVDTAVKLIAVPSRTGDAGAVSDRLAEILCADGFSVQRPAGGHPTAAAVAVRFASGKPGHTLQFNGHLDTVHLPFVPPKVQGGRITGSGSADMKSGIAAAVEALRALRDTAALPGGAVLLTAHDLHETPWGDGRQLNQLIAEGYVGDAVLLPEYLNDCLPVIGRGGLTWSVVLSRAGPPVHEVMRPAEPSVIATGAELVARLNRLHDQVSAKRDPMAGSESVFIGQIHSGEIFNQYPQQCRLDGTRRWLPGTRQQDVVAELRGLFDGLARDTGTTVTAEFHLMRDAFLLPQDDPFVSTFQAAYAATSGGRPLKVGAKPFCDDGNSFWALAGVPAVTNGPSAGGAHTLEEWVSIEDLVRVAHLYALTAVMFCGVVRTGND